MLEESSILLIEDEAGYRKNFTEVCESNTQNYPCKLITSGSAIQGFKILDENNSRRKRTLAFVDLIIPDVNSDQIIKEKNYDKEIVQIVLISAHESISKMEQIKKENDYITAVYQKPIKPSVIEHHLKSFTNSINSTLSSKNFSYGDFDSDLASHLQQEASEIKTIMKRTLDNTLEMGRRLVKIKEILPYGSFIGWVNQELGLHKSTTTHFMHVWEAFGHRQDIIRNSGLSITTLYVLAAPSTTEDCRNKVIELANSGTTVSSDMVRKLKKTYNRRKSAKSDTTSISTIDVVSTPDNDATQQPEPIKINEKKQQIVGIIRKDSKINTFKKLGRHLLFCGLPTHPNFIEKCPSEVSLNIAFPDELDVDSFSTLFSVKSESKALFQSQIDAQTLDLFTFTEIIQNSIEIYTEGGNTVLFSYLPYPKLLLLAHNLECNCIIAEPDIDRVEQIISTWKNRMKSQKLNWTTSGSS